MVVSWTIHAARRGPHARCLRWSLRSDCSSHSLTQPGRSRKETDQVKGRTEQNARDREGGPRSGFCSHTNDFLSSVFGLIGSDEGMIQVGDGVSQVRLLNNSGASWPEKSLTVG